MSYILGRPSFTITHSEYFLSVLLSFLTSKTEFSNWPYQARDPTEWKEANGTVKPSTMTQAVIFGLGSLFNHSTLLQNVGWTRDVHKKVITYKTLRDINKGEELCISYGDRLTFVDADTNLPHGVLEEDNDILNKIQLIWNNFNFLTDVAYVSILQIHFLLLQA